MQLSLVDGLPFASITVAYSGRSTLIPDILVDTGSAATVLSAEKMASIGVSPAFDDVLYTIRGVGGVEVVFLRELDFLEVGGLKVSPFSAEVGGMDYGFAINGILGMDFLIAAGAIVDLGRLEVRFAADGTDAEAQPAVSR